MTGHGSSYTSSSLEVRPVDVIAAKRSGGEVDPVLLEAFLGRYLAGAVAEEQMSAFLMAVCLRGFSPRELDAWTGACVRSGGLLDWSSLPGPVLDKHSTGGVGDKISLPLVPVLVALGGYAPMISGRGLGHTGGTLDKLEAIPGFRVDLEPEVLERQLRSVGGAIASATADLAPADRRLYALRDVTATVDSVPLIAASIMSKKIAAGAKFLLLDVKVGRGAFMRDAASASELARTMVGLGERAGLRVVSRLTAMDVPLGFAAGNALEVEESVEILSGGGPADVRRLVETFAADLAEMSGLDASRVRDVLVNGAAMDVWRRMVRAQGGDPDAPLPRARFVEEVRSPGSGVLADLDALQVGLAAHLLGAGRSQRDDVVDPTAGVRWRRRPGDAVVRGEVLFELHTSDASRIAPAQDALVQAFTVGSTACVSPLLIDGV